MQPLTTMEQKWKLLDSVISDVEFLQKTESNESVEKINELFKKLLRVKSLKQNIEKDEQELKLEYVVLMRERNLYFEKLKQVQRLGGENNWKDKGGLLSEINNILFSSGKNDNKTV